MSRSKNSCLPPEFHDIVKEYQDTKKNDKEVLQKACRTGCISLVEFLERRGLEMSYVNVSVSLKPACQSGNLYLLRWLDNKVKPPIPFGDYTDLFDEACKTGNLEMVKWVGRKGFCNALHYNDSLKSAYESGNRKLVKWLDKKGKCPRELHERIREELGIERREKKKKGGKEGKCIIF